jgi:hypothetical protein
VFLFISLNANSPRYRPARTAARRNPSARKSRCFQSCCSAWDGFSHPFLIGASRWELRGSKTGEVLDERTRTVQRRTILISTIAGIVLPELAIAETPQRLARIGWVTAQQASSLTPYVEAFRSGLADLGYVEGRNLILVLRYGDDNLERVPELAAELVRVPVYALSRRAQPMC